MKVVNVAEFKSRLSEYLAAVQNGEELEIRKRNVPLARVVPIPARRRNRTVLGSGRGSAIVKESLTDPLIPLDDWDMLGEKPSCRLLDLLARLPPLPDELPDVDDTLEPLDDVEG